MYNLPNILTISRIAVIPFIFFSIYLPLYAYAMLAGTLFIIASITDYLDGYLARAWNETSSFGRLLDPIADKLLVATALVVIMTKHYHCADGKTCYYYIHITTFIPAFVILCREILVSGLREFLREVNVGLPVTKLAKWKTATQMTALSMMMFCELSMFWGYLGLLLLWVAAILTFITGYQYFQKSIEYVKAEEAKKVVPEKEAKVKASAKPASSAAKKTTRKTVAKSKTSARKTTAKKAKKTEKKA